MLMTERSFALRAKSEKLRASAGSRFQFPAPKPSKIPVELKEQWVEALRSGRYKQGFGELRQKNKHTGAYCFCVLGVLCDILAPAGFTDSYHRGRPISWHTFSGKSHQHHLPNQHRMMELGLFPSALKRLSKMNDEKKTSFGVLADYIEVHF